jgi:hypothetical protein
MMRTRLWVRLAEPIMIPPISDTCTTEYHVTPQTVWARC